MEDGNMLIELSKSDFNWFKEFLCNQQILMKSHIANGSKISDEVKNNLKEITSLECPKSGIYRVPIKDPHYILELLQCNTMACPGCSVSSVKHRTAISLKVIRLIEEEESEEDGN
jgi:hypothetical protein